MSSNEYELVEILILDLDVIGEITEGKKLDTKGKYLGLYDTNFWQGAIRWFYGDSRTSVADKIKIITFSSLDFINKAIKDLKAGNTKVEKKYLNMKPETFLREMHCKLIKANKGLGHLKDTYLIDILFTKQIQIHINALNRQIKMIEEIVKIEENEEIENIFENKF